MRKETQNQMFMQYQIKLPSTVRSCLFCVLPSFVKAKISDLFWIRINSLSNESLQIFRNISWMVDYSFDRLFVIYKSVLHKE
jgi:hypothetical protein